MAPTRTLPDVLTHILPRQQPTTTVIVDSGAGSSSNSGLDGGAIAGIVIGTVVGILLLWWIIRACAKPRAPDVSRQGWYDDTVPRSRSRSRSRSHSHRRRHRHHHHHRHRSSSRPVVLEEKVQYTAPRRPSAAYVYPERRSRSRSATRYYTAS
ncbi:hypothetical protein VTK56DRAFT_8530 [Thermocarpiscus australiensis]